MHSELNIINILLLILILGLVSFTLTGILRRYALANHLIDIPNDRSSHDHPTPRGGGLAIVITFLFVVLMIGATGLVQWNIVITIVGAGVVIALVGFVDDHDHIAPHWRLLTHTLAVTWALIWLGGLPPLSVFGYIVELGWLGHLFAVFYLVWLLNLYNFMDGIDGLASIEAITVCFAAALLTWMTVPDSLDWVISLSLAASVVGFLYWNISPARIFMGDVGSGFLGVMLGILSIQSAWIAPQLFWSWLILLAVFIVDATVTLVRRIIRGDKFYQAHRAHAYQNASRKHQSHVIVASVVCIINVLWLFPISYLVAMKIIDGVLGVMLAYIPLIFLALYYRAGLPSVE